MTESERAQFERLIRVGLEVQARLERLKPYVAGGTAAALHAGHRFSMDIDFLTSELAGNFYEVKREIESWPEWKTAREVVGVMILGSFEGKQIGLRQQRRSSPVETTISDRGLRLATLEEMVLIKAHLLTERGALRDYVDLVALVDKMGFEKSLTALDRLNELYPSRSSLTRRLRLAEALCRKPADADDVKLSEYKGLITPYDQEEYIYERGRMLAASLARRELERQSEKRLTREQEEGRVR
ncbi:nucleotidyl transferase AbiEii/AbiGii toxin family protein [Pyrinomonas methylaliphatogenes]|jgi:hypothetical protein|uniref:Uncharacterized protein n=1 Tax=Pyrinomonas methylaliphatogenes TaxID=454194 RepID=A0A0B6WZP5_9BACT|nr:nucleotidyl transferase AbiEii/AbiGii toxin family protein [Pyrinomonas methylaliphatogenes]CDM66753.1 protein of unknown function (DUF1814) [Pyrinomonas methylaliphatogenes]